ncbi:MbcA/ParS/Xre antitoxin family protein, partial [Sphingobium indicum]|uniref:MbcA/ParS/Xre antitoxin family protein n=1 Tax=Sphingobium indicum TaxID=332055 RepID=UPI001F2B16DB
PWKWRHLKSVIVPSVQSPPSMLKLHDFCNRAVMGIYKGLKMLLPRTANEWVRKPNEAPLFAGRPAIERMASGNVADLYVVRQYIDAQRG